MNIVIRKREETSNDRPVNPQTETHPVAESSVSVRSSVSLFLSADELSALADRLVNHADGIVNVAAHEMEVDIRLAARVLRQVDRPPPRALLPALKLEIESAAASCSDAATARRLRQLTGGDG
jgi:hypothetical protein